ncbi:MAG: NAD(P)-binding domain-containing protein [Bauldia sp.]
MKIGIMGTGDVGRALGRGFVTLGHDVRMGARTAGHEKALAWASEMGSRASEGTFADAAKFGELLVFATLGTANPEVVKLAGAANFAGKVVIDATNPLDFSGGFPPDLNPKGNDSGGETLQRAIPDARVVKAFNTVGNVFMFKPQMEGGPPDMFIAGDDAEAKKTVTKILADFGWPSVIDFGGIKASRWLEAMCIAWVLACVGTNNWRLAFKVLRG